ncbi:MAG: site-specific integrase [Clostridia bacterium]|nr:site-specific integrase [Clostridia bacterium]
MRKSFTYNGQRHYIRAKDETDYEIKKALKIKELEEGKIIESNMLVRDWAEEWLTTYKFGTCNDKTYKDYQRRLDKTILPEIGHIRLKDVKSIHAQNVLQKVSHMSQSRIDKIYQCMDQVFESAIGNDLITKNPVKYAKKPKGTAGSHRSITDEERKVILEVAETHKHGLWVKIILFCGLRTGETPRVKICHFDFEKKLLFIDGTKNKNARRYVPVPDEILQEVKALNKDPFEFLFTNQNGRQIQPHNRGRMWKSFKRAMHLHMGGKTYRGEIIPPYMVADDLVPYCLRHTYCTDLQDAGVPINVAKDLMGHSDISLTAKIYTHTTETSINNAAELIGKFRDKEKKKMKAD